MAGSIGATFVGPAGLQLKAWALINGSTGAIVAGSGLTFSSKTTGAYQLTIAAQTINATVLRCQALGGIGGNQAEAWANLTTTTNIQLNTTSAGAGADLAAIHLEVWGV